MKLIISFVCVCAGLCSYAQTKELTYILPDKVEVKLNDHLKERNKLDTSVQFYFFIKNDSLNTYTITVIPLSANQAITEWVTSSSRYALVNKKKYPVITDYDFIFGTPDSKKVGVFGNRDGNIKRSRLISHSYSIHFSTDGNVLKED